jgi:undecaprenyl-diphosphatase
LTYLTAALLGVIQGVTEFLPVSSTAHLLVAGRLLGVADPVFTVMIQLGSMLAIMWLYRVKIATVIRGLPSDQNARRFALMIAAAVVPALVGGALLGDYVQAVLYESIRVIAAAFIVGGLVMLLAERFRPVPTVLDAERVPLGRAVAVGSCQMLALIPGVSRSGRHDRGWHAAAARSGGGSGVLVLPGDADVGGGVRVRVDEGAQSADAGARARNCDGFVMAFIASAAVVRPFLQFVRRSGFAPFAWYRIAVGVALLVLFPAG